MIFAAAWIRAPRAVADNAAALPDFLAAGTTGVATAIRYWSPTLAVFGSVNPSCVVAAFPAPSLAVNVWCEMARSFAERVGSDDR